MLIERNSQARGTGIPHSIWYARTFLTEQQHIVRRKSKIMQAGLRFARQEQHSSGLRGQKSGPIDVTDKINMVDIIHASAFHAFVRKGKAARFDYINTNVKARRQTKHRAKISGNFWLINRDAHYS